MAIIEIKVPSPGESITEVQIGSWMIENGDVVELDDVLCEIESDKATLEIVAEADGAVEILIEEGEIIAVGTAICKIDTSAAGESSSEKSTDETKEKIETATSSVESKENYASGHPSPAAKKILDEKNISTDSVTGTGKNQRITKEDALKATENSKKPASKPESSKKTEPKPIPAPTMTGSREVSRKKMSMLRKKIAERLVSVKNETAMLTTFNEVDLSEVKKIRKAYQDKFVDRYGIKLGFMSFFTKAVCEALKDFPTVNGMLDGNEMIFHDYVDMGIAVSTPKGLMVPVIRNAESMSLAEIELAIRDLATKARDGKLSIDEMTGGTFTITNGGVFGSMLSTPIINPPQSAILGMHSIQERPIAVNGEVQIRPMMYLAVSYDHRIIDGKESVSFLVKVKEYLENPIRFLLGV